MLQHCRDAEEDAFGGVGWKGVGVCVRFGLVPFRATGGERERELVETARREFCWDCFWFVHRLLAFSL